MTKTDEAILKLVEAVKEETGEYVVSFEFYYSNYERYITINCKTPEQLKGISMKNIKGRWIK